MSLHSLFIAYVLAVAFLGIGWSLLDALRHRGGHR